VVSGCFFHYRNSSLFLFFNTHASWYLGFVSGAQRNVIMAHADSNTFIKHYCSQRHPGMQEIMCGLNPDEEFARAVTRMSQWIDKRHPRYLNDAEWASIKQDPELQVAKRWQNELQDQCDQTDNPALLVMLKDQKRNVINTRRCLQERLRKELRQDFSRKQAVINIQRQLTGSVVNNEHAWEVLRQEYAMPPEQIQLVEKLFTWPTTDLLEDEWTRRNEGAEAVRQYCGFLEGGPLRGRPKRSAPPDEDDSRNPLTIRKSKQDERPSISAWEKKFRVTKEHIQMARKPLACFQCFKEYAQHDGVKRHFRQSHLSDRKCNFCDLRVQHEMHLRRHAEEIHRLRT
jgi:hypothetical protein